MQKRTFTLTSPIMRPDGTSIMAVTMDEIIGRHAVQIGDDLRTVQRYYRAAQAHYRQAREKADGSAEASFEDFDPPGAAEYDAMLRVIRETTDLGDAADNLSLDDIEPLTIAILSKGE